MENSRLEITPDVADLLVNQQDSGLPTNDVNRTDGEMPDGEDAVTNNN